MWKRVDRVLYSDTEMILPCLSLLVVSALGAWAGYGLDLVFRR